MLDIRDVENWAAEFTLILVNESTCASSFLQGPRRLAFLFSITTHGKGEVLCWRFLVGSQLITWVLQVEAGKLLLVGGIWETGGKWLSEGVLASVLV